MRKAYSIAVLLLAITFTLVAIAVVTSDDAEAIQYDLRLNFRDDSPVRMARGLNPVTYNYTIRHTGDVLSQETHIQMYNVPPLWNIFFSASTAAGVSTGTYNPTQPFEILIQRGEVSNLSVTITPPLNQLNQTFWFEVKAWPKKDISEFENHTIGVIIPQVAGFEIVVWNPPPGGVYKAIPPSTITIRFALFNTGNGVDHFLVQGESSRSDAGWKLSFVSGRDQYGFTTNLTPDPNKRNPYFLDVKIPIPAGERAGITAQVTVNATSMFNMSRQMPPAFVTLQALQYYNFQVFIVGNDKKEGTPGQQVEFKLQINNLGNGWDTFSVKPVWDENLNPDFIASANPRQIDIDNRVNDTVQYIVKVPTNAPKKTYFFTAEVTSISTELSPVTKSFAVEVGQYFAIELSSPKPRMSTIPGGILDYEIIVRNAGNGLDSIELELMGYPPNWLSYITPPEASLLQAATANIQIRIIVPSRFEEAPIGSYNLTVRADSARSDVQTFFDIQVDITQFYKIEWMYQDQKITDDDAEVAQKGIIKPRRSFNPYAKNTIDITLEIKNFGNGDDNISLSGYSTDPRVDVSVSPVMTLLLRDQTKFVKVSIEVPEDIPPGVYSLNVNASSQDPEFIQRVVPLDFEVFNFDASVPPIPTFVDPETGDVVRSELSVNQRSNLSFKLRIENAGTKAIPQVTVRVFDNYVKDGELIRWNFFNYTTPPIAVGDRFIVGERPYTANNPPLYWYANLSGVHTLEFKVSFEDQSVTQNDIATINITVEKETEGTRSVVESPVFLGGLIAVIVAVLIVGGYVFVLRRKPQVDADLYSSIYGADFEEEPVTVPAEEAAPEGTALTPEQQALYGDDYGEGEYAYDDGDYTYDDEDYDYDYEEPET